MKKWILFALLAAGQAQAQALYYVSGNKLSSLDETDRAFYVAGVIDTAGRTDPR
jgi:hypothetical protein